MRADWKQYLFILIGSLLFSAILNSAFGEYDNIGLDRNTRFINMFGDSISTSAWSMDGWLMWYEKAIVSVYSLYLHPQLIFVSTILLSLTFKTAGRLKADLNTLLLITVVICAMYTGGYMYRMPTAELLQQLLRIDSEWKKDLFLQLQRNKFAYGSSFYFSWGHAVLFGLGSAALAGVALRIRRR